MGYFPSIMVGIEIRKITLYYLYNLDKMLFWPSEKLTEIPYFSAMSKISIGRHILFTVSILLLCVTQLSGQFTIIPDMLVCSSKNKMEWHFSDRGESLHYNEKRTANSKGPGIAIFTNLNEDLSIGFHYRYKTYNIPFYEESNIALKNTSHEWMLSFLHHVYGNEKKKFSPFIRFSGGVSIVNSKEFNLLFLSYTSPYTHDVKWTGLVFQMDYGTWLTLVNPNVHLSLSVNIGYHETMQVKLKRHSDNASSIINAQMRNLWIAANFGFVYQFGKTGENATNENNLEP